MNMSAPASIWLCDGMGWWVEIVTTFFRNRNIAVRTFETTSDLSAAASITAAPPLTLMACSRIDVNLRAIVAGLARDHHRVVVLTSVENLALIRTLFLSGAADVVSRFPDMATLVSLVNGDFRAEPRGGYDRWMQPSV